MLEFRCGWVGLVSVLQAYQELATILLNYHIGRIVGWVGVVSVLQASA